MDVFPIAYFGPISYYKQYVNSPDAALEVKEHFVKQTVRTRCEILGPNGKQILSIPVQRVNGNKTKMDELLILEDGWRKIHWKSIETAYSSAAHFDYYGIEVHELIFQKCANLVEFIKEIHLRVLSWLDIEPRWNITTAYLSNYRSDYRKVAFGTQEDFVHEPYHQVFELKDTCVQNLSILDLIFNQGPMARKWLLDC